MDVYFLNLIPFVIWLHRLISLKNRELANYSKDRHRPLIYIKRHITENT